MQSVMTERPGTDAALDRIKDMIREHNDFNIRAAGAAARESISPNPAILADYRRANSDAIEYVEGLQKPRALDAPKEGLLESARVALVPGMEFATGLWIFAASLTTFFIVASLFDANGASAGVIELLRFAASATSHFAFGLVVLLLSGFTINLLLRRASRSGTHLLERIALRLVAMILTSEMCVLLTLLVVV